MRPLIFTARGLSHASGLFISVARRASCGRGRLATPAVCEPMFAATGAQPAIRSLICPDVPRTEIALSGMRRRRPSGRVVTLRWPLTRAVGRPASVRAAARRPRRRQQMVTTDALERNYRPSRRPDGICPKCSYTAEAAAPRANGPVHRCLFSLRGRSAGGQTYATGWKTPPSLSL